MVKYDANQEIILKITCAKRGAFMFEILGEFKYLDTV